MDLIQQLNDDLKAAMKAGDKSRKETLRSLKSALREKEIELNRELSEEDQMKVIHSAAKKRRESIESYRQGGRDDLVKEEEAELAVIEQYLPEQMDEDEIRKLVDTVIKETGAETMQDIGKVMGAIMPQVRGKADGSMVQNIVREKLS